MADYTTSYAQLMDWTLLDDTAATPSLESSELDCDTFLSTILHIDVCHADTNDAGTANVEVVIWIKSGTTDEDWHELVRFQADAGQANLGNCDAESAGAQPNVYIAATANFDVAGQVIFFKDEGTLVDSALVVNKDVVTDDYFICVDNLVNTYDADDNTYDIVNQWNVELPPCKAARVTFHNPDGDANYACRIRSSQMTDIE